MTGAADRIVELCEHDPADNVDPHPKLFSDLDDDSTSEVLFELWQKGLLDAEYDEDEESTLWRLTHFGVELCERGLVEAYCRALEGEFHFEASPATLIDPEVVR